LASFQKVLTAIEGKDLSGCGMMNCTKAYDSTRGCFISVWAERFWD